MKKDEDDLYGSIRFLKGVGPKKAELLGKLGVNTPLDLLYYFPRAYADRHSFTPMGKLVEGRSASITGEVTGVSLMRYGYRKSKLTATLADDTGFASAVWFNQPFLAQHVVEGARLRLFGTVSYSGGVQITPEEFEVVREGEDSEESINFGRIVPVYGLTQGLRQKDLRKITLFAAENLAPVVEETLPRDLLEENGFPGLAVALRDIHWPRSSAARDKAARRMKFDELFQLELVLALTREHLRRRDGNVIEVTPKIDERIRRRFPFKFTAAQDRAVAEITADLGKPSPMNRLLQGDVGSGKTAVALYAMLAAIARGFQAAIMAPTEILAEQHYLSMKRYLENSRTKIELVTGSDRGAPRREKLAKVASGETHIIVGTHALIQKDVDFNNLGIVVVDEQHKFGVMQRARLKDKGRLPDLLVMTATPIPRTLAMTAFGDLDVSIIDELPPGRMPVKTRWLPEADILKAYELVRKEVAAGGQAFIVYPVIEDSEALSLRGAKEGYEKIRRKIFPEFEAALLHGGMKSEEKDAVMTAFRNREFDILVSTVVIEVGIDVPSATVMLVEHAGRFGLAQLHQLRGRIGRGGEKSLCLLVGDASSEDSARRLKVMTRTSDGFKIAEEDLKIRGPGELLGTRQHGLPELRIADLITDYDLLVKSRNLAGEIAARGRRSGDELDKLFRVLEVRFGDRMKLLGAG